MAIERPDWDQDGEAVVPSEAPVTAVTLTPAEGTAMVEEAVANANATGEPVASELDPVELDPALVAEWSNSHEGFDAKLEMAQEVAIGILASLPDPDGFKAAFDTLPQGVQGKVYRTLAASPHLRGDRLLNAVESTLTLEEQAAADQWFVELAEDNWQALIGEN